ncbi:hypothetical protein ACTA71_000316 [Dictyostelium dimigraforme]
MFKKFKKVFGLGKSKKSKENKKSIVESTTTTPAPVEQTTTTPVPTVEATTTIVATETSPNTTTSTPTGNATTTHDIRANLEAIIKGIQDNKILEVFDKYYHNEIVMFENGDSTNRVGKEANRKAEEAFVNNATIHEAKVLKTIVDGDNTAYEMFMDFTYGGHRVQKTQWCFQQWSNGLVIKEEFNENKGPAPAPAPVPATEEIKTQETTTTTTHDIRANLEAIIKGIQESRILEVFDKYYHDEIVMFENGDSTNRVGKEANRKAEESFVNNATIHEAKVLKTIVDGDNTAYEMFMDFTYGGNRVQKTQWAFQQWSNGLVIKEEFNENKGPAPAPIPASEPALTSAPAPAPEPAPTPATEETKVEEAVVVPPITHDIRANLEAIIKGIQESRILEVFDKYYHDEVVMFENGDSTNRVGKEANRKAEESFVNNATIHEAKVLKTIVDGDNTAYEMFMDFTYGGHRVQKTQWAFQQWSNGLVIKEEFNENKGPAPAPTTTEETKVEESVVATESTATTTTTTDDIRSKLESIIKGIQDNKILETFDKYYHDEVVMFEKGDSTNRVGKEQNRAAEEAFAGNATIHEAKVLKTIVDGENSAYEMFMDFTYGGNRVQKTQWAFQQWSNGLIIKEEFN